MKSIVFAGGCFWGVQEHFNKIKGVSASRSGYTGGKTQLPSYDQVCSGSTGHTEACLIHYDPLETNLIVLLENFFSIIDPTQVDQQGPDVGTQYRSGIYYYSDEDKDIINQFVDGIRIKYDREIATEIKSCSEFWEAEEYHQNYLDKNPNGHCILF